MTNESFVSYEVRLHPQRLEMSVKMHITGDVAKGKNGGLLLELPTWVPGDYSFESYGRDIFSITAHDARGSALPIERKELNGYLIRVTDGPVLVEYQAACYEPDLGDAMGIVDTGYTVLMGTRYLFCVDFVGACSVDYAEIPDGWRIHHPSGATRAGNTNKWTYPSFEILLDTPVCFGGFRLLQRIIKDTIFYFVFVDKGLGFDEKVNEFVDKVSLTAEKIHDVFGLFPFSDYTFILSLNPQADWGLEHLTSNMSGIGPEVFVDDGLFATGIRVCAHELFHAWNVRRLRPAPFGQLKHQLCCGSFTEGLWMAEGFTRYYEFLISARAKVYSPDQFFSAIAGYFQHLTQQPAYSRVSVTDASLATYMNHSKYPGRVNNSIDYYDKGMLIAFGLDARLRSADKQAKYASLDDSFKAFYLQYFGDGTAIPNDYVGYTTKEVIQFYEEVQPGLGSILAAQLMEPGNIDTDSQLEAIGFEVKWLDTRYLGLFFLNDGAPTIYGVADDSPAGKAGIAPNDVIQAINGFAFSQKGLEWAGSQTASVHLEVLRGHRKLTFQLTPAAFRKMDYLLWKGTDVQAEKINRWLDTEDFKPAVGQRFDLDFYDNFHGIEKMV